MNIYFAAPLFTMAEKLWNKAVALGIERTLNKSVLLQEIEEEEIKIVLPQDHEDDCLRDGQLDWGCVYKKCLYGISRSKLVIAVLDGSDADSGTCFEVGYAKARCMPIIGIRTDCRPSEAGASNAMLVGACDRIVKSDGSAGISSLAKSVAEAVIEVLRMSYHLEN